jgi:prefoldin subunit 5
MELFFSAAQKDPDLEASIQETAENILRESAEYFESEMKSLELAKNDIHFVKALLDQLKSSQ